MFSVVTEMPTINDSVKVGYVGVISWATALPNGSSASSRMALMLFSNAFSQYDGCITATGK